MNEDIIMTFKNKKAKQQKQFFNMNLQISS
jgi:hypothetical protein